MSLTIQQICTYAKSVLKELGVAKEEIGKEGVYYSGYGLSIAEKITYDASSYEDGCDRKIVHDELVIRYGYGAEIVFEAIDHEPVNIYKPGDWELILEELFVTEIPKKEAEKRYFRDWENTREFLLRGVGCLPFFGYKDETVEVTIYRERNKNTHRYTGRIYRISVHELHYSEKKHWWSVRACRRKLVFDSYKEGDQQFIFFVDGEWKAHLARIFEKKRLERKAEWEESQPTAAERINQIRRGN